MFSTYIYVDCMVCFGCRIPIPDPTKKQLLEKYMYIFQNYVSVYVHVPMNPEKKKKQGWELFSVKKI